MATSGTTTFSLDLLEIVEEAYERCGAEARSGYDMRTARRSLNLLFADWANRGLNLWTLDSGSISLIAGTATYALPADTIDLLDCVLRSNDGVVTSQNDRAISRISNSVYTTTPNKMYPGTPNQMVITRGVANPSVTLYPVPSDATQKLVYWRLRRMQDVTGGADSPDVPYRLLPPMVSGLAYYLSFKVPEAAQRMNTLKMAYDEDWGRAQDEDREKSPTRFIPRVARV
jgi:hypothetical protein